MDETSECEPFVLLSDVARPSSAEEGFGAGFCRNSGMLIVSVEPLSLARRTASATFESRTKINWFLPTTGVTVKCSGAGVVANGLINASAVPFPAIDFGQAFFGPASRAS